MVFEQIPFKMELSIFAMLHLFETKILEKNLRLVIDYDQTIPTVLLGDPVRLHQIILNLVSNAVKFTSKGSITVSVKLIEEDSDKATIQFKITDTGLGIPEHKLDLIFENFQQASSGTSRLYGGTGLGLAIVKQLVEPQGGTITVESEVSKGSSFSFTLSFLKTQESAEMEIDMPEPDFEMKNVQVLVVEDIPLNQLLMKTILADFGCGFDVASNGRIAVEMLQSNTFDIVLMDLQMPEMNGFEAADCIRKVLKLKIPIIALTADVTTVDLAKCKAVGMNDYIAKPVDERLLRSKILHLIKRHLPLKALSTNDKQKEKSIDLNYLNHRTKSNPVLMLEMIDLFLEQTIPLVNTMKLSFENKDWDALYAAAHKMIPSFVIMGISNDLENTTRLIKEYSATQEQTECIPALLSQLEHVCIQACDELKIEYQLIKNKL
jgi:CheY-like chemotaxis protein